MVGLSGRQGQLGLAQHSRRAAEAGADFVFAGAVTVDSGYDGYRHDLIATTASSAAGTIASSTPKSGGHGDCSTVRHHVRCARGFGAECCIARHRGRRHEVALGHHLDDFVETLLLNLFFAGALKAMPARLVSDNGEHVSSGRWSMSRGEARNYAKERAADHRLLLPGVRRLEPAAAAREAPDLPARGRAPGNQELDDPCPRKCGRPPPPRSTSKPFAGVARFRAGRRGRPPGVEKVVISRQSEHPAGSRGDRIDEKRVRDCDRPGGLQLVRVRAATAAGYGRS